METSDRFGFALDPRLTWLARGVHRIGLTAHVDVGLRDLTARFGPWLVCTPLENIVEVELSGPYRWWKVIGPHWSLADHGLTFGTNARAGVCLRFHEPIAGGDPLGRLRHPGLTVTVQRPDEFARTVRRRMAPTSSY